MKINQAKTVFLHGIAGSGMRGLAWILLQQGKEIRGTDTTIPDDFPDAFKVAPEDSAVSLLEGVDLYIHSDAVTHNHPLYKAAKETGVGQMAYQEAVGSITQGFTTIAVAGTHGKSSTAAFLAHILIEAGLDPTVLLGAAVPSWEGKHARLGHSSLFVIEADEYRNHFHSLAPAHGIITSIDFDHPDFFASLEEVIASFQGFISRISPDGSLILPTSLLQAAILQLPPKTVSVSPLPNPAPLPGAHMQANAALAVAAAGIVGVSEQDAIRYLQTFPGLSRRFEIIGTVSRVPVISDYAHHPAEITATVAAARQRFPGRRIAVLFEAHTAERLVAFAADFAKALQLADGVFIYPPFIPKGRGAEVLHAADSLEKIVKASGHFAGKGDDPEIFLRQLAQTYDVLLACTAGNLDNVLRKTVNFS